MSAWPPVVIIKTHPGAKYQDRNLERQLDYGAAARGDEVARRRAAGRALLAGTEMRGRGLSPRGGRGARLQRRYPWPEGL